MRLSMFKSKIHRATVTEANFDYEGSVTVDQDLMDAAGMLAWEEVHVWNVDNGSRLTTYLLPGRRGSGMVCINGAAAHRVKPGHRVILATYAQMEEQQAKKHQPTVVLVDEKNRIRKTRHKERPLTLSA
jgi:aspartate 1-decarboxylase